MRAEMDGEVDIDDIRDNTTSFWFIPEILPFSFRIYNQDIVSPTTVNASKCGAAD